MVSKYLKEKSEEYISYLSENGYDSNVIGYLLQAIQTAISNENEIEYGLKLSAFGKSVIEEKISLETDGGTVWQLHDEYLRPMKKTYPAVDDYFEILKIETPYIFESFILYMEKDREKTKRFYLPRRKTLKIVAEDLQELEDGNIKFYGLSLPSRVGKSTICIFFLAWIALKRPNSHSAMGGHSGILAKGFYKELLNLMVTQEYNYDELFDYVNPGCTLLRDKSADELTITLDEADRFATITCRGIDGTWTGAIDISKDGYLYVDDLVRDREHSLSPTRMENTFQEYLNKMVDRKNDGAKELMVGTLWNVLDPLQKMKERYDGLPEYRFRRIPALNENDESNFDYEINGFSTEYYREMRDKLDNAEWMAKYMQDPFVREGLVYPKEKLRFFNGVLPEGDSRIVAACDVAWGGGDSLSMPIGREYENGDVYIFDWIFNNGAKEITLPLVAGRIIENEIRQIRFEGNVGGDMYCQYVDEMLQKEGYKCSCTSKKAPSTMEKMTKIVAYSGDVKRKFVFLDSRVITSEQREQDAKNGIIRYSRNKDYQAAMDELQTIVSIGKNNHEDSADGITQLAMFIENPGGIKQAHIIPSPF